MFPRDVATSNRASIGGMMGNNSSGAHSILYGRTSGPRPGAAGGALGRIHGGFLRGDRRGVGAARRGGDTGRRDHREVERICRENAAEVEARFPRIMRRVGGYNLDEMVRHGRRNLAGVAVGSEGTLVTVTEARLNLVLTPTRTALLVSHFSDLIGALEAVPTIIERAPAAVELVDRIILDLTRDNLELSGARSLHSRGEPEAILVTEFYGEFEEELEAKLRDLAGELERRGFRLRARTAPGGGGTEERLERPQGGTGPADGDERGREADRLRGIYGRSHRSPGRLYPGVPRSTRGISGVRACYYAHASVGCLHVRPILNLKEPVDQSRMREIAGRVADLVPEYGGAMSAEHGDGLVRSEWQEKMCGPQLYQAFREVKAAFDPRGMMNPGKIVEAPP